MASLNTAGRPYELGLQLLKARRTFKTGSGQYRRAVEAEAGHACSGGWKPSG